MPRLIMSGLMGLLFALTCLPLAAQRPQRSENPPSASPAGLSHEPLPVQDPRAFLEKCLEHYDHRHSRTFASPRSCAPRDPSAKSSIRSR
jgi:hypothetical protein